MSPIYIYRVTKHQGLGPYRSKGIISDLAIKKKANTVIFKTYSAFINEVRKQPKLFKMVNYNHRNTRITVTGADKLYGIEKMRDEGIDPNTLQVGEKRPYLIDEEDEEKFIRMILDRLNENKPMTYPELQLTVKEITDERTGEDCELPPEKWFYSLKKKYSPLFKSERVSVKLEVIYSNSKYEKKPKSSEKSLTILPPRERKQPKRFIATAGPSTRLTKIKKKVQLVEPVESVKLKFNFCRFCMTSTNKTEERDIPDEFLRIFSHFHGREVSCELN